MVQESLQRATGRTRLGSLKSWHKARAEPQVAAGTGRQWSCSELLQPLFKLFDRQQVRNLLSAASLSEVPTMTRAEPGKARNPEFYMDLPGLQVKIGPRPLSAGTLISYISEMA